MMVSTFPNWKSFASWYSRITRLTDELTPELQAKAEELTRHAKSDEEKLTVLYNYVTALRYVAVPVGINSFRPHAADEVLRNQFGDCKDKANLLNALLRSQNLSARLVLVPRFSQAYESVPGLSFNHAISQVILQGKTYWLDTTDDVCRFGLLPPGDSGRKVLVVDAEASSLVRLPVPDPNSHILNLNGRIRCSAPGEPSSAEWTASGRGYPDYQLRSAARQITGHSNSLPVLSAEYKPCSGIAILKNQTATSVAALEENFSWQADGSYLGLVAKAGKNWLIHAPFWLPREWEQALQTRETALFVNEGYPATFAQTFEISLPPETQVVDLPARQELSDTPLSWTLQWNKSGPDKITATLRVQLAAGELSLEETTQFQQQLGRLMSVVGSPAVITRNSFENASSETE
jgi:hypothetical protein